MHHERQISLLQICIDAWLWIVHTRLSFCCPCLVSVAYINFDYFYFRWYNSSYTLLSITQPFFIVTFSTKQIFLFHKDVFENIESKLRFNCNLLLLFYECIISNSYNTIRFWVVSKITAYSRDVNFYFFWKKRNIFS